MKKVLGLVISHRKNGNSELLLKEIMTSIPEESCLEMIRLTDLRLRPCTACYKCLQPDTRCPLDDDFNFVLDNIRSADALIIGVPVYLLGPHGYYKMLSDRLVGLTNYIADTQGKPCALIIPYGTEGWLGYSKAAAMIMPRLLMMKVVDCWPVHAALPGESLLSPGNVEYARQLGQRLFSAAEYQPGERECQKCGSDLFRLLKDGRVECPICGARSILQNGNISNLTGSEYFRFSGRAMEEHFRDWLLEMKGRFAGKKAQLRGLHKEYRDKNWWISP